MIYIRNGHLDDASFTGITVYSFENSGLISIDLSNKGYLGVEITKEEHDAWKERIASPDMVTYFPGIFPGIGVVDKATRQSLDAQIDTSKAAADLVRNRIVSSRQFNQGLILKGLDDQAEAVVYGLPDATPQEIVYKKVVANWYFKSNQFESKNPVLVQFAPLLGFDTTEKLNTFFDYCATL